MAFTDVTARGSTSTTSNGTTLELRPSANLTVGKLAVVCAVTDNYHTSDGASTEHALSDDQSNTWVKVGEYTDTDGSAADGVTISMFLSVISPPRRTTC
jgi:hypothetical protein